MEAVDLDRERLGLEAIAAAGRAGLVRLEPRQLLAHPGRFRLAPAPLDIVDDALERLRGRVVADAVVIGEGDLVLAGAVEHDVAEVFGERLPRLGHGLAVGAGERLERLLVIGRGGGGARPRRDGAAGEAQIFVGHHEVRLEEQLGAEPVAGRAGAVRVVEGEQPRLDLLDGEARHRAGELRREDDPFGSFPLTLSLSPPGRGDAVAGGRGTPLSPWGAALQGVRGLRRSLVGELDHGDAVGELERGLEAVGEAGGAVGTHHDAIDHDVDVVLDVLVEGWRFRDLVERAVDLDPLEALLLQLGEVALELALPPARDRRQEIEPGAFGQRQDAVDHLAHGLALDREPGRRRIGDADPRPQEPHIVVDLGDGADRGARIARGSLLLDGDRRRQPVDMIDVRLLHHVEELAGIGGERFHVAALALGIDGVEGEARFAGAGEAGDDHEPLARKIERDVLEVVLAGAADGDELGGHCPSNVGGAGPINKARKGLVPKRLGGKGRDLGRGRCRARCDRTARRHARRRAPAPRRSPRNG